MVDLLWPGAEEYRINRYRENQGIFLVHRIVGGRVPEVEVFLCQHGEGPLSRGDIRSVKYQMGDKFPFVNHVWDNFKEDFLMRVRLYGPALCVAKVYFRDDTPPLILERYINI